MKGRKEKKNEIRKYPDRYGYRDTHAGGIPRAGGIPSGYRWPAWLGCWGLPGQDDLLEPARIPHCPVLLAARPGSVTFLNMGT